MQTCFSLLRLILTFYEIYLQSVCNFWSTFSFYFRWITNPFLNFSRKILQLMPYIYWSLYQLTQNVKLQYCQIYVYPVFQVSFVKYYSHHIYLDRNSGEYFGVSHQILSLVLCEFKRINQLLFHLKSGGIEIRLNSDNIRSEI